LKKLIIIAAVILTACASTTGVVNIGKNTYMIAREDNGPAASLGSIKAATFKDASAFCATQGKTMNLLKESDTPRAFAQFPQTNIQFNCI
jgi:hypothetical protein